MITTTYKVMTPFGDFEAQWDEDEEMPVQYAGTPDAIAHFKDYLGLTSVSGREGALIQFDTLEPADLYGFCQSEEYGITVLPTVDDLMEEVEDEEPNMQVVLDAVDDAETFTLIGEGAQLLSRLDENADSFFDDLGRLREIIQALTGDDAPAPAELAQPDAGQWKNLRADILNSMAAIVGIDQGSTPGMDRSLFVSSIAGKIRRAKDRGDTALAGTALAFVAEAQKQFKKPVFAPANKLWKDVDWQPYAAQFVKVPAPAAVEPEPAPAPAALNVDGLKAVVSAVNPMPDAPAGWLIMNAPRPLVGDKTMEGGEFLSGRFYAAIDPSQGRYAEMYLDANIKLDAAVVFVADKATLTNMALWTIRDTYRAAYMEMDPAEREDVLSPFITKLNKKTYGELKELAAKGRPVAPAAENPVEAAAEPAPELASPNEPALENSSMETLIKIAADSIEKLRRIDVYRVLNSAGNQRESLATYIVQNRPDLQREVLDVMAEEWPDLGWSAPAAPDVITPPAGPTVIPPADPVPEDAAPAGNAQRAADLVLLSDIAAGRTDMWADDLADRMEAIIGQYPGDAEIDTAWKEAVNAYSNFMVKAMSQG